ncbi:hypothetical protein F2P81_013443 [Scophthalmus maximus]|uniref:Uncharacterized protein n=1 Tax=Scophthalmus maximus TaxID=52904 RepID=A0A6A4SJE0_SCOMX|nr:hypothetical protein F2P81_013443 [Scophthalmus maximus]
MFKMLRDFALDHNHVLPTISCGAAAVALFPLSVRMASRLYTDSPTQVEATHWVFPTEGAQTYTPAHVYRRKPTEKHTSTVCTLESTRVLNLQMAEGAQGEGHADETKQHGKPDKTLRFSLCSDNLEGISEGPSNRSNSVSSLDLEGESVSELGAGPSGSNGVEALQLLEHEQATTQDNLDDKLRKFEIRDMMGLTDDRDISETVSETWSTDVLGSDFDPNMDEDRLQEIAVKLHIAADVRDVLEIIRDVLQLQRVWRAEKLK